MDLRSAYKVTLEALDKRENELVQEKQVLTDKQTDLNRREKELSEAVKQLEKEQREVRDIKDVKTIREENVQKTHDLNQVEVSLKKKERELKEYENKLFEIKTRQDEVDKELREREQEVALREKTYKEEVEKAFAANLAKNLLTK